MVNTNEGHTFGSSNSTNCDQPDSSELGPLLILFTITSIILLLRKVVADNFRRLYEATE